MKKPPESIGVMIASYRRSASLVTCLNSLTQQIQTAHEVIVVLRKDDLETQQALSNLTTTLPLRVVFTTAPGLVAARNAGLEACTSDVLAILDDDTKPHPEWLKRVLARFAEDPALGGLGGRDRCFDGKAFDDREASVVGRIQWYGRMIGNHHLGFGDIREVDFLKGANMSFRSEAFANVRFDPRLKGKGQQAREDSAFSIAVKAVGWKLAYDPAAVVDHYPAFRDEARHHVHVQALTDESLFREFAYNDTLSLWLALKGVRRLAFVTWTVLVGTCVCPGFVQALRFTPRLRGASWRRFYVAQQGKFEAFRDLLFG
jgi:cellulose synthase/poly-beta-1,6-N-acetylglucosamine synthase-like glycosyltransferase